MERLKLFFVDNWKSKLVSLLIAVSIWYLIRSHLDTATGGFPVPGTGTPAPTRTSPSPAIEETFLGPFIPVAPPVPGGEPKG